MAQAGITFDAAEFIKRITRMQRPQLDRPVAQALDDTARTGKTRAAQMIQRRNGLKGGISYIVRGFNMTIRSSRKPNPLDAFPVSQNAQGVRISVWGKSQTLKSAFITSRGVYRRRGGAGRYPIRRLFGPTVWGTFNTPAVQSVVASHMRNVLKASLIRRLAANQRR